MIRLFSQTDKTFTSNGDVVLNPIKAIVHQKDNADYYLELECGLEYVDYLTEGRIIIAPTPQGEQAFRVYNAQKTKSKVTTNAQHLFFDSYNYLIADSFAEKKTCDEAIKWMNNATEPTSEFTVSSDITTKNSYRCVRGSLHEAIENILERWGGHLVRDNFDIQILKDIGHDNGVTVRYRSNLKEITCSEQWENVVTKILPVGKDGILLNGVTPSKSIYLTADVEYPIPYTKCVSFEQNDINQEDYPTETAYKQALVADLEAQARAHLELHKRPEVNYTLKAHLDNIVDIGDTIEVIDERLGINVTTNVIAYSYNCLTKEFTEIEFGNFKPTLSSLIPTITQTAKDAIIPTVDGKITDATNLLNTEITDVSDRVTAIEEGSSLINDYVTFQGRQDGWYVREWASGLVEQWLDGSASVTFTPSVNLSTGSISLPTQPISLGDIYQRQVSGNGATITAWLTLDVSGISVMTDGQTSATDTITYYYYECGKR